MEVFFFYRECWCLREDVGVLFYQHSLMLIKKITRFCCSLLDIWLSTYFIKCEGPDAVRGQLDCVQQRHLDQAVRFRSPVRPVLITLHLQKHTHNSQSTNTARPTPRYNPITEFSQNDGTNPHDYLNLESHLCDNHVL